MSNIGSILANIDKLQMTEQQLVAQLNAASSQPGFKVDSTITNLINQINNLSDTRIALFNSIGDQANIIQGGLASSRNDLVSQITLLRTVEDQLDQAKKQNNLIQNRNDTQMRLVEINTYYGKRYEAQSNLMKKIIFVCVPLLIFVVLKKKGILPEMLGNYVIGITLAVGAIFVIRAAWDITTRNNVNFDEYNWNYESPATQVPTKYQYNRDHLFNIENPLKNMMNNLGICIGSNCCSETQFFDSEKQLCIDNSMKQPFTTMQLQGSVINEYDDDDRKQNGIVPFSYAADYANIQ
jgi:hypothetical protein